MAATAAERQSQEDLYGRAHHVVELIEAVLLRVGRLVVPGSEAIVARGDQRFGVGIRQFIAGQLFQEKSVERLVGIEGANHVVPVAPGVWFGAVTLIAVGLG